MRGNQAAIDDNDVKSLLAVSSVDGESIVVVWADPVTHALLVKNVGGGGTPASPSGSIQFNNAGAFGGSSALTFDGTKLTNTNYINFVDTDSTTLLGAYAGLHMVAGAQYNTYVGYSAGLSGNGTATSAAKNNVGVGYYALGNLTTGYQNVSVGAGSLQLITTGYGDISIGYNSLDALTIGNNNLAVGRSSGHSISTGSTNTILGNYALYGGTTSSGNVGLGYYAGHYEDGDNAFYVNNYNTTSKALDRTNSLLYGTFNATPSSQTLTTNSAFTATYGMNIPTGQTYKINGVPISSGGSPASPSTSIQFNNAGAFGGSANATLDSSGNMAVAALMIGLGAHFVSTGTNDAEFTQGAYWNGTWTASDPAPTKLAMYAGQLYFSSATGQTVGQPIGWTTNKAIIDTSGNFLGNVIGGLITTGGYAGAAITDYGGSAGSVGQVLVADGSGNVNWSDGAPRVQAISTDSSTDYDKSWSIGEAEIYITPFDYTIYLGTSGDYIEIEASGWFNVGSYNLNVYLNAYNIADGVSLNHVFNTAPISASIGGNYGVWRMRSRIMREYDHCKITTTFEISTAGLTGTTVDSSVNTATPSQTYTSVADQFQVPDEAAPNYVSISLYQDSGSDGQLYFTMGSVTAYKGNNLA
jgi:hypothetical protein